jgi:uncharacterized RDD family membrane protein YckC
MSRHRGNGADGGSPGSPYPRAEPVPRALARLADLLVAAVFGWLVPAPAGIGLAALYLLAADALLNGQSPGKRIVGIKVVHVPTRRSCDLRRSATRNVSLALGTSLVLTITLSPVGVLLLAWEAWQAGTDPLGRRVGDALADTQVIDAKIPLEAPAPAERARVPALPAEVGESARVQAGP